jgi:hypothetical protein
MQEDKLIEIIRTYLMNEHWTDDPEEIQDVLCKCGFDVSLSSTRQLLEKAKEAE